MKRAAVGILLLFCGLVFSACSSHAPTKGDVTVFVVGPLSGSQANTGQTVAGGVKLMAETQPQRWAARLPRKVAELDDEADSEVASRWPSRSSRLCRAVNVSWA